jgi:hypothetical protein
MTKYIALYVFVLAALGFVALDLLVADIGDPMTTFSLPENQQETDAKLAAHKQFSMVLHAAIRALSAGQIPLREACANVYEAAHAHSPIYLYMIAKVEAGTCVEEKIAHNLVGHVEDRIQNDPAKQARLVVLELELREMAGAVN